jgi:hypothetical protein
MAHVPAVEGMIHGFMGKGFASTFLLGDRHRMIRVAGVLNRTGFTFWLTGSSILTALMVTVIRHRYSLLATSSS